MGDEARDRFLMRLSRQVGPERFERIEDAIVRLDEASEEMAAERAAWAEHIAAAAQVPQHA